jgi:hypothetical protein
MLEMYVSSVVNRDIGARVCIIFPSCAPAKKNSILFCSQIASRVRLVPIPSHLRGLASVEEVVAAAARQSEVGEAEEAERRSPLLPLQMIAEI